MSYRLISVSLLSVAVMLLSAGAVLAADAPAAKASAPAAKASAPAAKASAAKAAPGQAAEPAAAASRPAKIARPAKPAAVPRIPAEQLVDINSATAEELKKLPGIGAEEAAKIIAGRPYGSKSWLHTKNVLSEEKYQTIRELVAAKDAARHMAKKK